MPEIRIHVHYEKKTAKPADYILDCLGLDKNKDKIAQMIKELQKKPLSYIELSKATRLTKSATLHYLDILIKRGIVLKYGHKYHLAAPNFEEMIRMFEEEAMRTFEQLRNMARRMNDSFLK